jgi:hypothetical protein
MKWKPAAGKLTLLSSDGEERYSRDRALQMKEEQEQMLWERQCTHGTRIRMLMKVLKLSPKQNKPNVESFDLASAMRRGDDIRALFGRICATT